MARGFIAQRTRVVTTDQRSADGFDPFQATIVSSLTFAERDQFTLNDTITYQEIFNRSAPYVLAWNAVGLNAETGEVEPVPPPADAGPDAFRLVDPAIALFLFSKLREVYLGDDFLLEQMPSDDTPDGANASDSDSPPPVSNRRSRKTSNSSNGST